MDTDQIIISTEQTNGINDKLFFLFLVTFHNSTISLTQIENSNNTYLIISTTLENN